MEYDRRSRQTAGAKMIFIKSVRTISQGKQKRPEINLRHEVFSLVNLLSRVTRDNESAQQVYPVESQYNTASQHSNADFTLNTDSRA